MSKNIPILPDDYTRLLAEVKEGVRAASENPLQGKGATRAQGLNIALDRPESIQARCGRDVSRERWVEAAPDAALHDKPNTRKK